jgi:HK97 family phage prohead protease/HK97 family phage major capsid protein
MNKTFYLNSAFETKGVSKKARGLKIAGYANTIVKDRAGDVVTAEAWAKGVSNFLRNPVMLFQHKHDCPIGRFDQVKVDKKGIFVEGTVSDAAEKNHGVQTLIKDGALKSFSVGFRVKDGKYNREDDSMLITDVELLEISVVSVPCNQDSLFSIRKSFDSDDELNEFKKSLKTASDEEVKMMRKIKAGITDMSEGHYHSVEMDENGNGVTTYASHMKNHAHKIVAGVVLEAEGHTHDITMAGIPVHNVEEGEVINERPMSPTEEEAMSNSKSEEIVEEKTSLEEAIIDGGHTSEEKSDTTELEVTAEEEVEVTDEKTVEDTEAKAEAEEIEVKANAEEAIEDEMEKDDSEEEELVARDPNESIPFVNLLSADAANSLQNGDLVNYNEKMYKVAKIATAQSPIYKFLEVDAEGNDCDNVLNVNADDLSQSNQIQKSEDTVSSESLNALHDHSTKENDIMADQVVDTIDLDTVAKEAGTEIKKEATPVATVSEPQVAKLVKETGEAIVKEADAADQQMLVKGDSNTSYTPKESAEVAELKAQMSKYQDEINALQRSKMHYQEQSRKEQFSDKEMANAVLVAKLLNKRDVFDTKFGARMKAVTSVDQFLSNFSSNIYTEMEQQLVVAPMFNRMAVDAKTFRVPVADEDTDGDVAQFASGTFATGIADATRVPTSNQNTISSVDFTPHKFMATTHLAKDEEEDTVLPLLDFLRAAATRRLARAIDKAILRGTGALSGFTAQPTNAITAGTGYASVIEGITNLTGDVGAALTVDTGSANDKADPSDIAAARTKLGKYGLQLGNDLVYITSIEGYNNLVTTSDFQTVDKFGPNATYLTGSVGAVYGIPIAISEFMDNVGTENNDIGALVYKPGFMIAERRGIEIESEYEPRQQVTAMYMSTRIDFKALTTNSSAALDATKYPYAVTVETGA